MNENEIRKILSKALDADESGNKELAIQLYTDSVEAILKIDDKDVKHRLNRYATQALDRAEELKGIKHESPLPLSPVTPHSNVTPVKSNIVKYT